jgi:hypothetical protein
VGGAFVSPIPNAVERGVETWNQEDTATLAAVAGRSSCNSTIDRANL